MAGKPGVQGMHKLPGIRRVRQGLERPALWYAIWYTIPGGDRSVCLGWTRRLPRHRFHRAYPASGDWHQSFRGWVSAVEWLLQVWEGQQKTSDAGQAEESQGVMVL
jgi:hypothetical protein